MIGLIAFGSIGLWLAASVWVAWRVARLIKRPWLKALTFATMAPLLVVAPLSDEIIGKYQFKRYCEDAQDVTIYGQIPVGEELYTSDGKWRIGSVPNMPHDEFNRLNKLIGLLIRWDRGPITPRRVTGVIPIHEYETRLFDARTGQLLAKYRRYSNGGGWLKRQFGVGAATGGFLLPQSCSPVIVQQNRLTQHLLVLSVAGRETR